MRICPRCQERFDDASRFCPLDGEPLPVDEADARIGTTLLGQFKLLEVCGKGAMGTVYRAWQTGMERQVAIKILRPELLRDPKVVARFDREARAVAKLQHPNIVTFFLVGHTDDGLPFLAMEYVEGMSLGAVAEHEHVLPVARALHIARQITSALAEAHAEGIVHRDLKPANILLTDRRRMPDFVKVLDFGIAKILGGEVDAREDLESRLTRTGAIFGTPHYIAPEQAQGSEVDHRADLYSLGVILYRLLTGHLPFDGTGMNVLLAHIGQAPVPPRELAPDLDPRIDALIMRALEKDPAHRFQSAEDMADALEVAGAVALRQTGSRDNVVAIDPAAAGDVPPADIDAYVSSLPADGLSTPPVRRGRGRLAAGLVAGLVLAGGAGAAAVWWRDLLGVVSPSSPVAAEPAPRPAPTPAPAPPSDPAPSGPAGPVVEMRTITLGEEGYAIRVQVPRDPRVDTTYTLVFDVIDRSGAPLELAGLPLTFEQPDDDRDEEVVAKAVAPGRYELARSFGTPGRHHVHVFPDASSKKLHIWFDLGVKDAQGRLPEPKVAQRPPRTHAPAPATPPPAAAPPAPLAVPAPIPAPEPTPPAPVAATPVTPEVHEGTAESDPYHDAVIKDEPLKEPVKEVTPPPAPMEPAIRPRIRWRPKGRLKPNPDGLE